MSKLEWNINFMLGIQEIDEHHEHLFELLNFGYDKFEAGHNIGLLVVAELVDYTSYHFSSEEHWMVETNYPFIKEHKKEHDLFMERVSEFVDVLIHDKDNSLELLNFVSNWITHHILETDSKFGLYLASHNTRRPKPLSSE